LPPTAGAPWLWPVRAPSPLRVHTLPSLDPRRAGGVECISGVDVRPASPITIMLEHPHAVCAHAHSCPRAHARYRTCPAVHVHTLSQLARTCPYAVQSRVRVDCSACCPSAVRSCVVPATVGWACDGAWAGGAGVGGYGFVAPPSPAPGVGDDVPVMTWGDIEGTPLILDPHQTPLDMTPGTSR
jgi:hypothetical protein